MPYKGVINISRFFPKFRLEVFAVMHSLIIIYVIYFVFDNLKYLITEFSFGFSIYLIFIYVYAQLVYFTYKILLAKKTSINQVTILEGNAIVFFIILIFSYIIPMFNKLLNNSGMIQGLATLPAAIIAIYSTFWAFVFTYAILEKSERRSGSTMSFRLYLFEGSKTPIFKKNLAKSLFHLDTEKKFIVKKYSIKKLILLITLTTAFALVLQLYFHFNIVAAIATSLLLISAILDLIHLHK
jgi:hypothetical protein